MTTDSDPAIREILGGWSVYPGHPLTVAFLIVRTFATYEEAMAPTGHGWVEAVGDSRIPGAGGEVHRAVDLLRRIREGMSETEALAWADERWEGAGGHTKNEAPGREQAERVRPYFAEIAAWARKEAP